MCEANHKSCTFFVMRSFVTHKALQVFVTHKCPKLNLLSENSFRLSDLTKILEVTNLLKTFVTHKSLESESLKRLSDVREI